MSSRVLLITPVFYGIEKKIIAVLEELGYEVCWIENKNQKFNYQGTNSRYKILRKLYFFFFFPHKRYIDSKLRKFDNIKFDILFSINGSVFFKHLFIKLKKENPEIFSILYLWDSFSMNNWIWEIKHFDKVITFDHSDSLKFGLIYKPNFYINNNPPGKDFTEYDLYFVGKFNSARFLFVEKFVEATKDSCLKWFIKLWPGYRIFPHNHLVYLLLKKSNFRSLWIQSFLENYEAIEGILKNDFLIKFSLDFNENQIKFNSSNVILDVPFQGQSGYTHRLIAALASGKKVITTNKNIVLESFYNPDQIKIVDIQKPEIDIAWIKERTHFIVPEYFNDLELHSWLASIIHEEVA